MEKLRPFAHLFGKTGDDKIAEMAGLSMEELHLAKAALAEESRRQEASDVSQKPQGTPRVEPDTRPDSTGRATLKSLEAELNELRGIIQEERGFRRLLEGDLRELQDSHRALAAAHYALDTEVRGLRSAPPAARSGAPAPAEPTPEQLSQPIKVIQNGRINGPDGRKMNISYGDVYPAGDMSAFLLRNYPNHVMIYKVG